MGSSMGSSIEGAGVVIDVLCLAVTHTPPATHRRGPRPESSGKRIRSLRGAHQLAAGPHAWR
eukprot:1896742-Prymnesium_polylepis.2